jgi:hypothetical protein
VETTRRILRGAASGTGHTLSTLIALPVIAVGVPALWVWLASQIAGSSREVTVSLAIFITTGIVVTYWLVALVGMTLRRRWVGKDKDETKLRRMSWNRSFRDEPYRPGDHKIDPVERVFVIAAVIGFIAFQIWFFFFAGSPTPGMGPGLG